MYRLITFRTKSQLETPNQNVNPDTGKQTTNEIQIKIKTQLQNTIQPLNTQRTL